MDTHLLAHGNTATHELTLQPDIHPPVGLMTRRPSTCSLWPDDHPLIRPIAGRLPVCQPYDVRACTGLMTRWPPHTFFCFVIKGNCWPPDKMATHLLASSQSSSPGSVEWPLSVSKTISNENPKLGGGMNELGTHQDHPSDGWFRTWPPSAWAARSRGTCGK